jgi:Cell Wall Hydrolase
VLTRSIDIVDPFELTIEEKIYRGAKRIYIGFAIAAVMLTALDLADIRPEQTASGVIRSDRHRIAALPNIIREGIQSIAIALPAPSAIAAIPSRDTAALARPADDSLVKALAAARDLDAVEVAMEQPAVPPNVRPVPTPNVQVAAVPAPVIFAKADATPIDLPTITLASLPMPAATPPEPVPRRPPGPPPPSPAELLHLEGKSYAKAERCLANAIYFEARSEPVAGQIAVAQVVMNRVFSGFYPNNVCGVIYQNANRHLACQSLSPATAAARPSTSAAPGRAPTASPSRRSTASSMSCGWAPRRTITLSTCTRSGCARCARWPATASTISTGRLPEATVLTSRFGAAPRWRVRK